MTVPLPLTPRHAACLRIIQDLIDATGTMPSLEQIASKMGLRSKSGAHRFVSHLVERGYVERIPGKVRCLRLLHRLPPVPGAALEDLLTILDAAIPSADGMVRLTAPDWMVAAARAAVIAARLP